MQHHRIMILMALALILVGGVGGCKRDAEQTAADQEQAVIARINLFFEEIREVESEEGPDAAVARMRDMLDAPEDADLRPYVFDYLISTLLRNEHVTDAQVLYLERAKTDPDLADAGFRQAMQMANSNDPEANAAWLDTLIGIELAPELRRRVWLQRIAVYAAQGSVGPLAERVATLLDGDPQIRAGVLLDAALSRGLQMGDLDGVEAILKALRDAGGASLKPELERLALIVEGKVLIRRNRLEQALDFHLANARTIGDAELQNGVRGLLDAARSLPSNTDLIQRTVAAIYAGGENWPSTRDTTSVWMVKNAVGSGDAVRILDVAEDAFQQGASVSRIFFAMLEGFYPSMQNPNAGDDLRNRWMALIRKMKATEGLHERDQGAMSTALLDGTFFMNDFQQALELVKAGIPGFDEKWHNELTTKIKAHIALQEKRFDDAVALFREHMRRVEEWTEPVMNPENGQSVIKEVVLGFNEKRIGDIWSRVEGRSDDAREAYTKARQYYEKALQILAKGTPEYENAASELENLPDAP